MTEFLIDAVYKIKGVGTVVCGELVSGSLKIGDRLNIGPDDTFDLYHSVTIKSINTELIHEVVAPIKSLSVVISKIEGKHVTIKKGCKLICNSNFMLNQLESQAESTLK